MIVEKCPDLECLENCNLSDEDKEKIKKTIED